MAARSVAEILPRRFEALDLDDVTAILQATREERETLFLERKAVLRRDLLSKGSAAFANTMGGLLIFGVADDSDELVGIEDAIDEAQVWVKDVLRSSVVPLPPFRARRLEIGNGRWLLLVLVEASSTTPHLLARQGAIYVRNPGSSDPVPIADQRLLLELQRRGEQARVTAQRRALDALAEHTEIRYVDGPRLPSSLALAATGVSQWFEDRALHDRRVLERLASMLPPGNAELGSDQAHVLWHQHSVSVHRLLRSPLSFQPRRLELVQVWRDGVVLVRSGYWGDEDELEQETSRERIVEWIDRSFRGARELLLDLGAHGDVRLALSVAAPRGISWPPAGYREVPAGIGTLERWTGLDLDEHRAADVLQGIEAEIGRALGIGPQAPSGS